MRPLLLEACTEPGVTMVMVAVVTEIPCTGKRRQIALGLFTHGCDIQTAVRGLGKGGYFTLGRVVDHQAFAVFADAIDQSSAVAAGDQISVGLEEYAANVLLIALEKELGMRGGGRCVDPVDGGRSAGRDVEQTLGIECQIPGVVSLLGFSRSRIVGDGGGVEDQGGVALVEAGLAWPDAIHLTAGHGGRVHRAVRADPDCLHGQVFGGKELGRNARGRDFEHGCRRARGDIGVPLAIGSYGPNIGRRG